MRMQFHILKPDSSRWAELFESLPLHRQDAFYSASFARVCQSTLNQSDEVRCAAMTFDGEVVLYPFVRRNIGRLTGQSRFAGLYDLVSLYGRGGIVASEAAAPEIASFHAAMGDYCRETSVTCGFDRFHPVIGNDAWAAPDARVMDVGGFVVVDMRPEMSSIEESFKPSVRKDLRKAERNGIVCFAEANCDHLREFLNIYYHTMGRNSAAGFYYFSEQYFASLSREMRGQFHFFYAMAGGEIVSCELVLHHGKYCHSFLGGTKQEALSLCANPMLKREIIRFLKDRGCEHFLLGGGARAEDGIFNFKKAYAPEGVLPSRVGGTIWDHQAYERLKHELPSAGVAILANRFQFYDPVEALGRTA
jgi:hypothetical protein